MLLFLVVQGTSGEAHIAQCPVECVCMCIGTEVLTSCMSVRLNGLKLKEKCREWASVETAVFRAVGAGTATARDWYRFSSYVHCKKAVPHRRSACLTLTCVVMKWAQWHPKEIPPVSGRGQAHHDTCRRTPRDSRES